MPVTNYEPPGALHEWMEWWHGFRFVPRSPFPVPRSRFFELVPRLRSGQAARDWLLEHVTEEDLAAGGYLRVTGKSHKKTDNLAWILGWTLDALCRVEEI